MKALAACENAAVAERTWLVLRAEGAVVEEPASDDEGGGADGDGDGDEGDGAIPRPVSRAPRVLSVYLLVFAAARACRIRVL